MNKSGKTLTILLSVAFVLLLSLTFVLLFFYQKESEMRKSLEFQLTQAKASESRLESDLKDAKKQVFVLEEKAKESDDKINSLMDELELQEGLREELKTENDSLKETLANESRLKEALQKDLNAAQERATAVEQKLQETEKLRIDLETKVKSFEAQGVSSGVELEKIVVVPGEIPEGKVVSINAENNFLIFNLGQHHGITSDTTMSVYHNDGYLGDVKVSRVQEEMSVGDFIEPLSAKQVVVNDRVVIKK